MRPASAQLNRALLERAQLEGVVGRDFRTPTAAEVLTLLGSDAQCEPNEEVL